VLGGALLMACGSGGGSALRSPSLDYAPPPPSTSDGETVGADRHSPSDKLHEGASSSGPAPGWGTNKKGEPTYDPKRQVGGAIEPAPASGSPDK